MKKIVLTTVLGLLTLLFPAMNADAKTIRYVKTNGNGAANAAAATSWNTACKDLQAVINASEAGDEIWVAAGTYIPNSLVSTDGSVDPTPQSARDYAFVMKKGVKIYGGFPADANDSEHTSTVIAGLTRNPIAYPTILSGDLLGNDEIDDSPDVVGNRIKDNTNSENAHHVVIAIGDMGDARLDGFHITGGNADGSGSVSDNAITIFRANGGGIYALIRGGDTPEFCNNSVYDNSASSLAGGIYARTDATITIFNNTVYNNQANLGGGIYAFSASFTASTEITISNNTVYNNQANLGGGIYANTNADAAINIYNNTVYSNQANTGGGIYANANNNANAVAAITISNNTVYNNQANLGGGIYANANADAGVIDAYATINIYNCIVWNNLQGGDINAVKGGDIGAETINFANCLVSDAKDDWTDIFDTSENIIYSGDPLFANATAGDFRLRPGSPCINAGSDDLYTASGGSLTDDTDLAGNLRKIGEKIDMGALECAIIIKPDAATSRLYVKEGGAGTKDGSSWANAMPELADALDYAQAKVSTGEVTEIWVAAGTYKPLYKAGDGAQERDRAFVMVKDVKIYGGFVGNEQTLEERILPLEGGLRGASILSGDLDGNDEIDDSPDVVGNRIKNNTNSENAHHVVIAAGDMGDARLDGFHITGGNADGSDLINVNTENTYRNRGSGIYAYITAGAPEFCNNSVYNNQASDSGGGICAYAFSSATIFNNTVYNNQAATGGGIYAAAYAAATITISNNTAYNNQANNDGGGIYAYASTSTINIFNNTIYNNKAGDMFGGGIYAVTDAYVYADAYAAITISNNTVYNNQATTGGGIYASAYGNTAYTDVTINIYNCIIWNNLQGGDIRAEKAGGAGTKTINFANCLVSDAKDDWTDIFDTSESIIYNGDPLFVDAPAGDFRLRPGSPCINAGNNLLYSGDIDNDTDLAGNQRKKGDNIDMGALECQKINQADFSIDGGSRNKTYGDPAFTLNATGGSGEGDITWSSNDTDKDFITVAKNPDGTASVSIKGATTGDVTVTATKAGGSAYFDAEATITITVAKAELAIEAKDESIKYGEAIPELGYTCKGFVYEDGEDDLLTPPRISLGTTGDEPTPLPVDNYPIVVEGATSNNYDISYTNGTLTITPAEQSGFTIPGGNRTKTYGDANFPLAATGAQGAVTWSSSDPGVATIDEVTGKVTIIGEGKTTITATSAATDNYLEATSKLTLTVLPKAIATSCDATVALEPSEFTYSGNEITPDPQVRDGKKRLVKDVDYDLSYENNTNVGTATVTITGKGNYSGSVRLTFTILVAPAQAPASLPQGLVATYGDTFGMITLPAGFSWPNPDALVGNASSGPVSVKAIYNPSPGNYEDYETEVLLIILKADPAGLFEFPEVSETLIVYDPGFTLGDMELIGGFGNGRFFWRNSHIVPTVDVTAYDLVFLPDNKNNYDYTNIPGWSRASWGGTIIRTIHLTILPREIEIILQAEQIHSYTGEPVVPEFSLTGNQSMELLSGLLVFTYEGIDGTIYGPTTEAPVETGDYSVRIEMPGDINNLPAEAAGILRIVKGTSINQPETGIARIYPTLVARNGSLTLAFASEEIGNRRKEIGEFVEVYNTNGVLVRKTAITGNSMELQAEGVEGTYLYVVRSKTGVQTIKVMVK